MSCPVALFAPGHMTNISDYHEMGVGVREMICYVADIVVMGEVYHKRGSKVGLRLLPRHLLVAVAVIANVTPSSHPASSA